ncbi:Multifunctional non-homologous end joining protein LigD [subsurface metagenome]
MDDQFRFFTEVQRTEIEPMLAELGSAKDLDRKDWLYEKKIDGVRCVAVLADKTELQSRTGKPITQRFPELVDLHRQAGKSCVLDGEIAGTDFNAIQHRIHLQSPFRIRIARTQYPIYYYVFDILYLDGESVKQQPLITRKAILNDILAPGPYAKPLEWADSGESLFEEQKQKGLEGIMAKDKYATYLEGKRWPTWLKVKNFKEAPYYICGATEGENDRSDTFGSLILGELVDGKLTYVGNVGSGFTHSQLSATLAALTLYKGGCPFEAKPDIDRPVKFWARPELKCEVRYLYMPEPGAKLRFPTFRKMVS